jgi:hypothetical protein
MRVRSRAWAALVAIGVLLPGGARAQPAEDVARADALFNTAKQLRDAGLYADACPQFAQSNHLAPGVGVSLYLADCYEHVGKTASAWTEFRSAEKLARERNDKRAELAHTRALALEPKLSGLTVTLAPAVLRQWPEVLFDGVRLGPEQWNIAMAVNPGDHLLTVTVPGQPARTLTAHVDPGNRAAIVRVDDAAGGATSPASPPASTPAAPDEPEEPAQPPAPTDHGATQRWVGITLMIAGAGGAGLGTWFLWNHSRQEQNAAASCLPPPDNSGIVASAISYGAGGVAFLAGIIVTATASGVAKTTTGIVAAPMLLAGGGGALVRASF